jgi:4-carboxymuconolactone decarboxylase
LSEAVIDAIRDDRDPPFTQDDERLVYRFMRTLHAERAIPDDLYQALAGVLGETGVVDLVGIAGYYTLISMTIKVFEVPPPAGVAPELPSRLA